MVKISLCFYLFDHDSVVKKKFKEHAQHWLRTVTPASTNIGVLAALEAILFVQAVST